MASDITERWKASA